MNLFELYDYIESLEVRIEILEKLMIKEERVTANFNEKPPFYYQKKPKGDK